MENLAWEIFSKTGNIDYYLLYRQSISAKENCGGYGVNKDERSSDQTNQGQGQ